jgi:DhnA family fructose-bisphosphate aldolase class Ia
MTFWMIARAPTHPGSKTEPKQRYAFEAEAIIAARRMAAETGAPFVVLAVTHTIKPGDTGQSSLF